MHILSHVPVRERENTILYNTILFKDLGELNTLAQKYLIAHKQQLGDKSNATVQPRRADQKKSTEIDSPNQIRHKDARGHCSDTTVKVLDTGSYSLVQRLVPARIRVSQSSQKKTHAMVAQLDEDGEKACTCVEVKETRSKRNLKKSGTKGSPTVTGQCTVMCAVPRVMMVRPT